MLPPDWPFTPRDAEPLVGPSRPTVQTPVWAILGWLAVLVGGVLLASVVLAAAVVPTLGSRMHP